VWGHVAGAGRALREKPDPWGGGGDRGGAKRSSELRGSEQRGSGGEREGRRQGGAWGAPAPPAARPHRPGLAERSPAQRLEHASRGHAGHEGVAGPAKHLPGHHRHPV
jgi:hypothetical protein